MTREENNILKEYKEDLVELRARLDLIMIYLKDDKNSNSKGLVSRINDIEKQLEIINRFVFNAKWVILAIGLPVLIAVIRAVLDSYMQLKSLIF